MHTPHPLGGAIFRQTLLCVFYVPKLGGDGANRTQKWSLHRRAHCKVCSELLVSVSARLRLEVRKVSVPALGKSISHTRKLKSPRTEELKEQQGRVSLRDSF